jgi:hypothetical protein
LARSKIGFRDAAVVDAQGAPVNERPSSQLIANLITLAHGAASSIAFRLKYGRSIAQSKRNSF